MIAAEGIARETRAGDSWDLDRDCLHRRKTDLESAFAVGTESSMNMKRKRKVCARVHQKVWWCVRVLLWDLEIASIE